MASAMGAGPLRLMLREILPNALPPLIVSATLIVGSAILFEAGHVAQQHHGPQQIFNALLACQAAGAEHQEHAFGISWALRVFSCQRISAVCLL